MNHQYVSSTTINAVNSFSVYSKKERLKLSDTVKKQIKNTPDFTIPPKKCKKQFFKPSICNF